MIEAVLGLFVGVAVLDLVEDEFGPDAELAANAVVVVLETAVPVDTETESVDFVASDECAAAQVAVPFG